MQLALLVGFAGFLGTISRYLLGQLIGKPSPEGFPYSTLFINLLGCLIIGLIYGFAERGNVLSSQNRIILSAGFCGGFTTFSAFSLESLQMFRNGSYGNLTVYVLISVIAGFAITWCGYYAVRLLSN